MYKNSTGIPLSLAVWLAYDEYDHNPDPKHISATSLLKSVKQIVLSTRIPTDEEPSDISNLVQARMGTAIHNQIESSWLDNYKQSMTALGYSEGVIDRVIINPKQSDLDDGEKHGDNLIPIYMEQRVEKTVDGVNISVKYDFVADGVVEDFKSTSTFTYVNKSNDAKYKLQGSIYKWLNPTIITKDYMVIQYIFTDWKAMQALANPAYPKTRTLAYKIPLLSVEQTQQFVENKIRDIKSNLDLDESRLPACTDEDLWRREPVYKYYKNPQKTTRSTKNFPSPTEANIRLATDGNVGIVVEVKGEVIACRYCDAKNICKQKDNYIADGTLKL